MSLPAFLGCGTFTVASERTTVPSRMGEADTASCAVETVVGFVETFSTSTGIEDRLAVESPSGGDNRRGGA